MYITKINSNSTNKNNLYFKAKLSEKEIIQGVDKIIYKGDSFIEENLGYFLEMKKGSNIEPNRKAQIDKWITEKLANAISFNAEKQEQITRNEINFLEQQETPNIFLRNLKKGINFVSNLINNETPPTHPLERKFNSQKEEMNFFRDFKDLFTSYLELRPKINNKAASIKAEKPLELQDILQQYGLEKYGLDMTKQNDNIKIKGVIEMDRINISTSKADIKTQNISQSAQPAQTTKTNQLEQDTFERGDDGSKLTTSQKATIGTVVIAGVTAATYALTRGRGKKTASKAIDEGRKLADEIITKGTEKKPGEEILSQFEEYEQRRMNSKPRTQMTTEEIEEDCRWYREEYFPLLEKIKQQNISTIPHKIFSDNPLEQVQEKHDYIRYVLSRMSDNEASYYDGMIAFEKYGINGPVYDTGDYSRLSFIKINFPKTITKRCVNKLMDLYEKFAKGLYLDKDGFLAGVGDDISYMSLIAEKGAITSIPQLKRALEKGKKFIWNNDGIKELHSTLTYGENAPFKNNQEVEEIIQEFYQTAFNNRTPFKDYPDIKAKETQLWGIHRD